MENVNHNILRRLYEYAVRNPDRVLFTVDDENVRYEDFFREIGIISAGLSNLGVKSGDMVAVIFPNSVFWYMLFWSVVNIGAFPVPLDPQTGEWELRQFFTHIRIRLCFSSANYRGNDLQKNLHRIMNEHCSPEKIIIDGDGTTDSRCISIEAFKKSCPGKNFPCIHEVSYTDTLMFASTSGTTGNPKMIEVEHGGFHKAMKDMADYLELTENDSMLLGMPLYHQGGFGMGVQAVINGGSVFYRSRFDPVKFLDTIRSEKITVVQLTATLAKILLTVPGAGKNSLSSVRMCYFAGEVLPERIANVFYRTWGIRVVNIVGSSESGTMMVWDSRYDAGADVNSYRPFTFTDVKIVDENNIELGPDATGMIVVSTDAVMKGYHKNDEATRRVLVTANGKRWYSTGDLGRKTADGRIAFVGRSKRIIKRGANLVYPEEIESYLLTCEGVSAVAVLSEHHDVLGEKIAAYVQPTKGTGLTRNDVFNYCKGRLSSYKIPDNIVIVECVPHDIGKVHYKHIRPGRGAVS